MWGKLKSLFSSKRPTGSASGPAIAAVPELSNRRCPYCDIQLEWRVAELEEARDRGGNERTYDEIHCTQCGRWYSRVVSERFDGNSEWWSVRRDENQKWEALPANRRPQFVLRR